MRWQLPELTPRWPCLGARGTCSVSGTRAQAAKITRNLEQLKGDMAANNSANRDPLAPYLKSLATYLLR